MHPFRAPRWLRNPHLQTLGAALPLWAPPASFGLPEAERVAFPLPSGRGALVGRAWWHRGRGAPSPRETALFLHGVGGSSESRYLVRAAVAFYRAGFHVVRLNLRGAGESVTEAPSLYHAALTEDPRTAIEALARDPRVASVSLVGFSLGGTVALSVAAEWEGSPPSVLRGVVAISAPLDLVGVSEVLEQRATFAYRAFVVRGLVAQGRAFARLHPEKARYDAAKLQDVRTIREYDERVIVPMHGFSSARQYYEVASAGRRLARIRVPTLIVHADDDPMVPGHTVSPFLPGRSSAVEVAWSEQGGHVGWFAGMTEGQWVNTWAIDRAMTFLAGLRATA